MKAVQLLVLALMLASPLAAQRNDLNKIAEEALPAAPIAVTPSSVPPKPEKVFDKKFFAVMGSLGAAESIRFTTRQLVLENEKAAGAPWVTSVPSHSHLVAKNLALYGSEFLVAYELKKPHPWLPGDRILRRLWWAYPVAMTAIHFKNAVGNIQTKGPGGCTSMQCALQMP